MKRLSRSFLQVLTILFGSVGCCFADVVSQPLVHITFNNDSIENTGSYELTGLGFSGAGGAVPVYVSTGLTDSSGQEIKAIKLDGTNYVNTTTTTGSLGISGASAKSVSAIIKPDQVGNYCLWNVGNQANYQDFTIKISGDTTLMSQLWGGDFNTTAPTSISKDWGLVSQTYDGSTVRVYYNGGLTGSSTVALDTGTTGTVKVGYWVSLDNSLRGGIGEFQIDNYAPASQQIRQAALDLGGSSFTFNDSTNWATTYTPDPGWVAGASNNMFTATGYAGSTGYAIITYPNREHNQAGTGAADDCTGVLWGQAFTVTDDTKEITLKMAGGHFEAPTTEDGGNNVSALKGKAGFVLYDVTDGKFLLDSYRSVSASSDKTMEAKTVSLSGLKGHTVSLAIVDFATGSWGMTAVDDINIPLGTGAFVEAAKTAVSAKTFNFDDSNNWEGWYQVDSSGNPMETITSFQFGSPGTCYYYIGDNYITSTKPSFDAPTGTLRSETFQITGDIIEFMINGGHDTGDYGFELWVQEAGAEEYKRVRTAQNAVSSNNFSYDFWDVTDYEGLNAFLQLRDNFSGSWGWVGVDNIQMVDFSSVPEPSTWALLLAGAFGLLFYRKRKNANQ